MIQMMFLFPTGDKRILSHTRISQVSLEERVAKTEDTKEVMNNERWMKACFSLIAKKNSRNSTETGKTVDGPHFQRLEASCVSRAGDAGKHRVY